MSTSDPVVATAERRGSLVDVLDTGLRRGIAVRGEIVLSIADVDLVAIDLRAVLAAVDTLDRPPTRPAAGELATDPSSTGARS